MLPSNPKLHSLSSLVAERETHRQAERTVVMTNGCFDLLHVGHVSFLQQARQLGDRLIVALNSDDSVRSLKGPKRPIQTAAERAFLLGALECVDAIVIFSKPDLTDEIASLRPDIYTKAGDYTLSRLHAGERAALEAAGTKIQFLPFLAGFSTTAMIGKIFAAGSID